MKKDTQNQIKRLAEMKLACQENPMQLDRLKEYQREAMAFDWDKALISDGMVLLPREPTDAMKKAYDDLVIELGLRSVVATVFAYKTMIKAYEEGK